MIYGYKYEPLLIRVPTWIDRRFQIQGYDADNLYPQRAKEARNRSFTTKSACARYGEFIVGEGFEDKAFGSMIVNAKKRHTANDLLDHVSESMSWANGFYIHVGYNLNYRPNCVLVVPFEFPRFGIPDGDGEFSILRYCNNWENNPYKNPSSIQEIFDYPIFNPDPAVVKDQIESAGGIRNYLGQIFVWTPEDGQYPKATFDAVIDQAQTQSEIGILDLAMEQNGLKAGHAIMYPGKFETTKEEKEFKDGVNAFSGQGAGGALILENPSGTLKANEIIVPLQMQNADEMHEGVDKRVRNAIRTSFGMPPEIIGEMPESGMFNKQQMEDAYAYYNSVTSKARNVVSRQLAKIFSHWHVPVSGNFNIVEKQYTKVKAVAPAPQTATA